MTRQVLVRVVASSVVPASSKAPPVFLSTLNHLRLHLFTCRSGTQGSRPLVLWSSGPLVLWPSLASCPPSRRSSRRPLSESRSHPSHHTNAGPSIRRKITRKKQSPPSSKRLAYFPMQRLKSLPLPRPEPSGAFAALVLRVLGRKDRHTILPFGDDSPLATMRIL